MALSERLQYILDFNTTGGVKSLQALGQTADKELGKAESKLDKLSGNLTKFGTGAVAFAGVAGAGLVKLASGAAEAEANTAALRQVVDELAATQIEEWAEGSATAVGLASKEAIAATTGFAGLGKIIGLSGTELTGFSTGLVEMAANMAAFKDVSPQQALQDLQSLFAGSTEVGRKYNIFLDDATLKSAYFRETGEQVSGTLTAQQRIIATNSELYRQGADMIGQWGRESSGLAGQQAQLRANLINLGDAIGKGALPMLTQLVGGLNSAVTAFSNLDPGVQSAIGKFAAMGVAGIGLIGALSAVAGQVIKLRDRFTTLNVETGTRQLNNFGKAAAGLSVGLGVAGLALAAYSYEQQQQAQAQADLIAGFRELSRVTDEQVIASLRELMAVSSLPGLDNLDSILGKLVKTNLEVAKRILESGAAAGLGAEALTKLSVAVKLEEAARARATATAVGSTQTTEKSTIAVGHASKEQRKYEESLLAAAEAADEAKLSIYSKAETELRAAQVAGEVTRATDLETAAIERSVEMQLASIEATDRQSNARRAAADATFAVRDAEDRFAESVWNATVAQNDQETSSAEQAQAIDGVRQSAITLADEQVRLANETAAAEGRQLSAKVQADLFRSSLENLAAQLTGPQKAALEEYIALLNAIPSEKTTTIRTVTSGRGTSGGISPVPRGGGGIVSEPVTLVGEHGPELVSLPAGSQVHTANQTRGILGGQSNNIQASSPGAIREAARRMLREEIERYFAEAR